MKVPTLEQQAQFMQRALEEAQRSTGRTHPNPMVGCVIVRRGRLVAVGHHVRAGLPHAEIVALQHAGAQARGADMYVTLEPCSHHGRTGPCSDAVIAAGIKRVWVGMRDPYRLVNGRGIRKLRAAGIEVTVGLLQGACASLNEAFVFVQKHKRPFVAIKIAQSLDGKIATASGESQWITSAPARRMGHTLRNRLDAILVGSQTVLADDPRLTCRIPSGRDPVRVVLDTRARISAKSQVCRVAQTSQAPTWVCVGKRAPASKRRALERAGAQVIVCKTRDNRLDLDDVMAALHARSVFSVLVEGGPTVVGAFFDAGLVNQLHAFIAPIVIGGAGAPTSVAGCGVAALKDAALLSDASIEHIGRDIYMRATIKP